MQMVLKCADIGHLAAPPRTHRRWAFQLEEEFFRQVLAAFYYAAAVWFGARFLTQQYDASESSSNRTCRAFVTFPAVFCIMVHAYDCII